MYIGTTLTKMPVAPLPKDWKPDPNPPSSGDTEFWDLTDDQRKAIWMLAAEFRKANGDPRVGGGKKPAAKKPAAKKK
jgi:hypothetical protein